MPATVDFCGERHTVVEDESLTMGREGDVVIDENPYLHRRFLRLEHHDGLWWLANVGSQLSATVADHDGRVQTWLAPGARVPLVLPACCVWFSAGPTSYEIEIFVEDAPFEVVAPEEPDAGSTTYGRASLTPEQRLLLVALAEPMLRRRAPGAVDTPSSAEVAARLGWTITKFNRKLDNVCQKLGRLGVRGLHGGSERVASDRKARLVEYSLAARLVTQDDLTLLDGLAAAGSAIR